MARLKGVPANKANFFTRIAYWYTKKSLGKLIDAVTITAHSTPVLKGMAKMESAQKALMKSSNPALITLAEVKVATMVGCPF